MLAAGAQEPLSWLITTWRFPPEARLLTVSFAAREPLCAVELGAKVALPLPRFFSCQQDADVLEVQPASNDGLVTSVLATADPRPAPTYRPTTRSAATAEVVSTRKRRAGREIRHSEPPSFRAPARRPLVCLTVGRRLK